MARMDDNSPHCERWTNAKLMREARRKANLETFGPAGNTARGDAIRKETRLYRECWLNPLLDEIERRWIKPHKAG